MGLWTFFPSQITIHPNTPQKLVFPALRGEHGSNWQYPLHDSAYIWPLWFAI